jgi:hypothetical protein
MRPIVSVITALAVNLHLVLGCCAHHAHKHVQHEGNAVCPHTHSCSHGHNDAAPAANSPGPVLPPHDDCHDSHCAFRIASALDFSPDLAVAFLDIPAQPTARELAPLRGVTPRDRGDPFELAVRPHLLHQSFLN